MNVVTSAVIPNEFKQAYFRNLIDRVPLDNWRFMPPDGWGISGRGANLEESLPFAWDVQYERDYGQKFQPNIFYNNSIALSNYAQKNPGYIDKVGDLYRRLFERMLTYTTRVGDALFVRNDFQFGKPPDVIPSGWSGGIMNAFVLTGLLRAVECFNHPDYHKAIRELAAAHKIVHRHGRSPPPRWFTYVDQKDNIWFDEYPLPNGEATMVLNGHVFNILALALYVNRTGDRQLQPFLRGGLTTVKERVLDFRRQGQVNIYALRPPNMADYAPHRTVRQQSQLFCLTRDHFFRGMAEIFYQDIREATGDAPDRALSISRR